jgi:hypothetical protein
VKRVLERAGSMNSVNMIALPPTHISSPPARWSASAPAPRRNANCARERALVVRAAYVDFFSDFVEPRHFFRRSTNRRAAAVSAKTGRALFSNGRQLLHVGWRYTSVVMTAYTNTPSIAVRADRGRRSNWCS